MNEIRFKKICLLCKKEFKVDKYRKDIAQYCSRECVSKCPLVAKKIRDNSPIRKGMQLNTGRTHFKKGHIPANKGVKGYRHSGSFKKGHTGINIPTGEKHWKWKGENAKYSAKHSWIRKHYGKAYKCENPKHTYINPKMFQWAKLQGKEYERKRENFWMLCASCHKNYDRKI